MVRDTKGDTRGNVLFIWTEPSVALSLTKDPMKESIVPVIVHEGGRREREGWPYERWRDVLFRGEDKYTR